MEWIYLMIGACLLFIPYFILRTIRSYKKKRRKLLIPKLYCTLRNEDGKQFIYTPKGEKITGLIKTNVMQEPSMAHKGIAKCTFETFVWIE